MCCGLNINRIRINSEHACERPAEEERWIWMQPTETQIYLITVEHGPAKIEGKLKTNFKVKIKDRVKIEEKAVTGEVV